MTKRTPAYRVAAEKFRPLLRTETFPVGSWFGAVPEIQRRCNVTRGVAYDAARYLEQIGEIKMEQLGGKAPGSLVLPAPDNTDAGQWAMVRDAAREARNALDGLVTAIERLADSTQKPGQ
jgi:hypothetical protein